MKNFVLCLFIYLFIIFVVGQPCVFQSNSPQSLIDLVGNSVASTWSLTTPSRLQMCFNSIPFSERWRKDTINNLLQAVDLYSFADLAQNPGDSDPYNLTSVDLKVELAALLNKINYSSDWEFQSDLISLFRKLYDKNMFYFSPTPYRSATIMRPWRLDVSYNNASQKLNFTIKDKSDIFATYLDLPNQPINKAQIDEQIGRRIVKINGYDINDWFFGNISENVVGFADFFPSSKDKSIRFNDVLQVKSETFMQHTPGLLGFLANDTETYTIEKEDGSQTELVVPLLALVQKIYSGVSDFSGGIARISKRDEQVTWDSPHFETLYVEKEISVEKRSPTPLNLTKVWVARAPSTGRAMGTYYKLSDNSAAILDLRSFGSTGDFEANKAWYSMLNYTHFDSKKDSISKLVIYVSGNSGGSVCLATGTARYLMKNQNSKTDIYSPYDFRISETWKNVVPKPPFSQTGNHRALVAWNTSEPYTNSAWSAPVNKVRAGGYNSFTQKFAFNCEKGDEESLNSFSDNTNNWWFDKIIVLTDGTCSGACAQFVSMVKESNTAKVVTYGGIPGHEMDYGSSFGGRAETWSNVVKKWSTVQGFPTTGDVIFNLAEFYSRIKDDDTSLPREFRKIPGNYHMNVWMYPVEGSVDEEETADLTHLIVNAASFFHESNFDGHESSDSFSLPVVRIIIAFLILFVICICICIIFVIVVVVRRMRRSKSKRKRRNGEMEMYLVENGY